MKRKMMYVCEKCGEAYPDEKYAKMCEKKHVEKFPLIIPLNSSKLYLLVY